MAKRITRPLGVRLTFVVGGGLILFSLVAGVLIYAWAYRDQRAQADVLQDQLVRAVQGQTEVAAFAANREIGRGVLDGLVQSPVIEACRITADINFQMELSDSSPAQTDFSRGRLYPLWSPVDKTERIGTLTVLQSATYVEAMAAHYALTLTAMMLGQVLLATGLMMVALRLLVMRPVAEFAEALSSIQAGSGERLAVKPSYAGNELGQLAESANGLLMTVDEAIKEERSLRSLLETTGRIARIGGWTYNATSQTVFWTKELYWLHERDVSQPIDVQSALAYFTAESRLLVHAAMLEAIRSGVPVNLELQMLTGAGQPLWVRVQGRRTDADNLVGAIQDITERKASVEALQKNEEIFRAISDNVGAVLFLKDLSGRYLYVNRRYEGLNLVANSDVLGLTAYDIFPRETADAVTRCDRFAVGSGQRFEIEDEIPHDDGMHTYLTVRVPVRDAAGKIYAVCGIATDITERKRLEREALAAKHLAETARTKLVAVAQRQARELRNLSAELMRTEQRERDRLYQVLHDDMQPLLVAARLSLTSLGAATPGALREQIVGEACGHLGTALELARLLSNELSPPLLRERGLGPALEVLGRWMGATYNLKVDMAGVTDVAIADGELQLVCFNVVRELLLNVVKHAGVVDATLTMRHAVGASLQICIEDRGCGFDPRTADAGSGLAAAVRRLGMVGGALEIVSAAGAGARITLSVPLHHGAENSARGEYRRRKEDLAGVAGAGAGEETGHDQYIDC